MKIEIKKNELSFMPINLGEEVMLEKMRSHFEENKFMTDRVWSEEQKKKKTGLGLRVSLDVSDLIKQTEKAFGGCKNCYGKGYSTVKDFTTAHADFIGDKKSSIENNPMKYCSCERGKQLESLLTIVNE